MSGEIVERGIPPTYSRFIYSCVSWWLKKEVLSKRVSITDSTFSITGRKNAYKMVLHYPALLCCTSIPKDSAELFTRHPPEGYWQIQLYMRKTTQMVAMYLHKHRCDSIG